MWGAGGPYHAWVDFLRRWRAQEHVDPGTLPAIELRDLTDDNWVRLSDQLNDAISDRLRAWSKGLGRALSEAPDDFQYARAMVDGRAGVQPIRALAGHAGLPTTLSSMLLDSVDTQIRNTQQTIEEQVDRQRQGGNRSLAEARLKVVRDNALTAAIGDVRAAGPRLSDVWAAADPTGPRRRVIVDPPSRKENR